VTVLPRLVIICSCSIRGSPVVGSISGWPNGPGTGTWTSVNSISRERISQLGTPSRLVVAPVRDATNRLRSTWRMKSARSRAAPA